MQNKLQKKTKQKQKQKRNKKIKDKKQKGTFDKINFITLKMDFAFMDNIKLLN